MACLAMDQLAAHFHTDSDMAMIPFHHPASRQFRAYCAQKWNCRIEEVELRGDVNDWPRRYTIVARRIRIPKSAGILRRFRASASSSSGNGASEEILRWTLALETPWRCE